MSSVTGLSPEQRASCLLEQRAALLGQLPARFPGAGSLGSDTRELIVDEAIEYASLEHTDPIAGADQLSALFWGACANRVKRAHEGRYDTVRAGYRRDDDDSALQSLVAAGVDEPLAAALQREEREWLAEVLRTLSPRERDVIAVKYMSPSNQALGYKKIARHLALGLGDVRAAERSIREKFDRFATATRAHEAALERKLGQLLPVPPAIEHSRGRFAGWRDVAVDWIGRPFGSENAATATHLAASGAGRGAGGALAIKLATLCIGAGGLVGAACVATGVVPTSPAPRASARPSPRTTPAPSTTPTSAARRGELTRARAAATATPTPTKPQRSKRTQGGSGPRDHENKPASPAPSNAAPNGGSEFDPTFQPNAPPQPAPVPAAPGSREFF
jgi:hypothetical protein